MLLSMTVYSQSPGTMRRRVRNRLDGLVRAIHPCLDHDGQIEEHRSARSKEIGQRFEEIVARVVLGIGRRVRIAWGGHRTSRWWLEKDGCDVGDVTAEGEEEEKDRESLDGSALELRCEDTSFSKQEVNLRSSIFVAGATRGRA